MKIFFGGIIQGSNQGQDIHSQDYRNRVKRFIKDSYPDIDIFDPVDNHEQSVGYDDQQAHTTFFGHLDIVHTCDLMIAYLPQASLGTAIEMKRAYDLKIPIVSISPMTTNWVIRLLTERNFETVEAFEKFIADNDIREMYNGNGAKSDNIEETA
ncbi:MAG: hypothetical protein GY839_04700 [candidate division Zixibacteria bacterium]|nr:hypothetical protein [candidate division Zixibacteria bacterium]